MRILFEHDTERSNIANTLRRLIESIPERSHSTAEEMNLKKALALVLSTPVKEELY